MSVRVVSARLEGTQATSEEKLVFISRPHVLGNPFFMKDESQRASVINRYRQWLTFHKNQGTVIWDAVEELALRVRNGEKLALRCWCAPLPCHGDVLVEAIESINQREKSYV